MRIFFVLLVFLGFSCQQLRGEENFILIDGSTSEIIKEFGPNIEEQVTPASSFKIVLSLMGYNAGILQDEQTPIWHFQEGYDDYLESWKQSQTPQTWMNCSCIWFSKIIALQLGLETLEQYLSSFEYGNQDFSAGMIPPGPTNPAWVSSSLKISPKEQVEFVQKMIRKKLPISSNALQMTKNLLFKEEISHGWKLFGKVGLGSTVDENGKNLKARWFVGWVENGQSFFPFAYLLQKHEIDGLQTVPRVKQLLEESNLWNLREGKMQKELITMPEIKLVGICVRTSNEQELDKMKGNIFPCVQKYFHQGLAEKISNRKKPGTTFCAYTDYEADHNGEYTYFIGEEVSGFNNVAERAVRPLAIGRKNWLFVGNEDGGEAAGIILSLIQTCRALSINPREYLEDVMRRLMSHNSQKLYQLLPDQWKANR